VFIPAFTRGMKPSAVRVSLTASHSSTVAEECIALLRSLHSLPVWNQALNHILANKLAVAGDLLTEGPLFRNHQVSTSPLQICVENMCTLYFLLKNNYYKCFVL
jgi:hypothetical protein